VTPLPAQAPPTVSAVWLTAPVTIDGRLDEPIWRTPSPASRFTQSVPRNGEAPSQRTEVWVAYDAAALYVAVRAHDTAPDSIAQQLGRRDDDEIYSDRFYVGFDSYGDRRTAFLFGITPRGVLSDFYVSNDTEIDPSWDGVWNAAARIDGGGWSAEYRIPLSQFRYDVRSTGVGSTRAWGINFGRSIARLGEEVFWAPVPADAPGVVSRFGVLTGLDSLRPPSRMELVPYLRSQLETRPETERSRFAPARTGRATVGGDLRVKLPQSLTLTATVNPDFGQVEADPAVVNLTAFEVFFRERRPFFLENADGFGFGSTRTLNDNDPPRFFYSRRIGRPPQRRPSGADITDVGVASQTPIAGALKLSGTTPSGWQVGMLNAVTPQEEATVRRTDGAERREAVEPRSNYHVSRVRRLLRGGNTGIGAFFSDTRRDLSDSLLAVRLPSMATVAGIDWEHAWKKRTYAVSGVWSTSRVRGDAAVMRRLQLANYRSFQRPDATHLTYDPSRTRLGGHFAALSIAKTAGQRVLGSLTYEETSPGFEVNDLGFQVRSDTRSVSSALQFRNPFQNAWSREWDLMAFQTVSLNFAGDKVEQRTSLLASTTLLNFWDLSYRLSYSNATLNDRLLRGGPMAARPTNIFQTVEWVSDPRRSRIYTLSFARNTDASGRRGHAVSGEIDWRPLPQARIRIGPSIESGQTTDQYVQAIPDPLATATSGVRYVFANVRQREARLDTRVNWTFSPWLSLQLFLQPFASAGAFSAYKEFTTPRAFAFAEYGTDRGTRRATSGGLEVDPDGSGPARPFLIPSQDFTVRALRGNAVLRWEYTPGSSLFLVWTQQHEQAFGDARFAMPSQIGRAFADPARHVFLVKVSRWIG
jgi:hypothetical protein